MPMYYHVCEASPNLADPYGALDAAEDYLSKKGHSNVYFTQMMKENLLQWGFTINETNATSNTSPAQPITPNTTIVPPMHSGIAELASKVDKISQHIENTKGETTVDARFQSTKNKPEDWYEKMVRTTNDHERSIRTMTEKIDALLQKIDPAIAEKYENQKRERREKFKSENSSSNKSDDRRKRDDKYKNKGDKSKYKDKKKDKKSKGDGVKINIFGGARAPSSSEESEEEDATSQPEDTPTPAAE